MPRPTISLCIIAKNEESNIERLLDSVDGCFDEIHVTDTGSTDKTVEICQKRGVKVHHFEWIDDFSAARNYAFDQSNTDYKMWIDCDDVLVNKEEFILWRDNVMSLADMWLATYDYASDDNGNPVCSFARERVIKGDVGIRWKYFVHEGLMPTTNRPISAQYATTWKIKHMRTAEDLAKDKSRNLRLIQKNEKTLDARMKYYYGKELFENQQEFDAIKWLTEAALDPSLEAHDRTLSMQYACYAFMRCNQYQKAIDMGLTGLQLNPQRAEFFTAIGDCYIKLNRPVDAVPYYKAASTCQMQGNNGIAGAIFSTADQYSVYPINQIIKIYANTNRLNEAVIEAKEALKKYDHPETKTILAECERINGLTTKFKDAKPCDDIVISCPPQAPYKWDARIYKEKAMGGSETAAIEMAQWLHKLSGRPVKIFNVRDDQFIYDGVEYIPTSKLTEYMGEHKPWLHISWRHNFKVTDAPTFCWSHDLTTPGVEVIQNYVKVMALTPFHKNYLHVTQGVPLDKIWVTRNGFVPERFSDGPWEKDPYQFVFSSSPDRGLEQCMRVLDKVRETYPQVKLSVFYGIEHLDNYGLKDMRIRLEKMFEERKDWVTYYGKTEQTELMKHFKKAAYNVQPSSWIETSCISALELVFCGIYPIFRAVGGVVDTLRPAAELGMASLVDSNCITESEYQLYVDETIKAIAEERYKRVIMDAKEYSWELVARNWLEELPKMAYGSI